MKALKFSMLALSIILMSFTQKQGPLLSPKVEFSTSKTPSIKWKAEELDLGEIHQNKPVSVDFEFKNTGNAPVLITNVQASCGCTTANYIKTPILPGESTKITATYNAAAKGNFKKTVTVTTNAEEMPRVLVIKGIVI